MFSSLFIFDLKNVGSTQQHYVENVDLYLKTDWAKEMTNVKYNENNKLIFFTNGVKFSGLKSWNKIPEGENIHKQIEFGVNQSI